MGEIVVSQTAQDECLSLIDRALALAKQGGASEAEVGASQDIGLSVSARMREVETIEYQNDRSFGITVYVEQRKGTASTTDYSDEAIAAAVKKALYIASQTGADEFAGLADAQLMATSQPDLSLDHAWDIDVEAAKALALETEAAALDCDARVTNSEGASINTHRGFSAYGNSHGFRGALRRSNHSMSCAVIAGKGDDMQRDYYYTSARNPASLLSAQQVGQEAAQRTLARLAPRKLATCKAKVIYRADLARGFISHMFAAISGSAQYRQSSFLLDAISQQVLPDFININEQPLLQEAAGSAAYDAEGVATKDRQIIADGVLCDYILASYSARRLGRVTTANAGGLHNAVVESTAGDLDELLRTMGSGLLITELMGQGVNGVTGDYSRGAAGFWVEGGELAYPVSEITVAGNLRELYAGVLAVGSDVDTRGGVRSGSILVDSMTIAGS